MSKIKVFPSILSCDFGKLAEEIKQSEAAGVDGFHLDIMDGSFVPNISFGPPVVKKVRSLTKLPLDAHLMIDNPWLYIDDFIGAGADIITLHLESYDSGTNDVSKIKDVPRKVDNVDGAALKRDIKKIKAKNKLVGISLNPGTQAEVLKPFLGEIDLVLVMSVHPGFSGQSFMSEVVPKITEIRKSFNGDVFVDGGINAQTAPQVVKAGANALVSASYFYSSPDYAEIVKQLKNCA